MIALGAKLNQHPPTHHERWMVSDHEEKHLGGIIVS